MHEFSLYVGESARTAKLRIWTSRIWCFSGPGLRSVTDAPWGGVTHTLGQVSKRVGSVFGADSSVRGSGIPAPQNPKSSTMKTAAPVRALL